MEVTQTKLFYNLFATCLPVKGAKRSVIIDTERENMYFVSNEMFEILEEFKTSPVAKVLDDYDTEAGEIINEYIEFLQNHELGFWTIEPERFPPISTLWEHPSVITNAIIDVRTSSNHDWIDIFKQLENLGCKDLQLRFYDEITIETIESIMFFLTISSIKSVELIIKYTFSCTKRELKRLTEEYFRIKTITVHSSPKNEIYIVRNSYNRCGMGNIIFVKQRIDNHTHCGQISESYFSLSGIKSFSEAKSYNSCLNRKLSIDAEGNIMNCPSLHTIYGNVKTNTLASVINDSFSAIWFVNKDQINICKDCEFRYNCTDCRAFLDKPLDKPKKCNYNPYKMIWENEEN